MKKREAVRLSEIIPDVIGTVYGNECHQRILESRIIEQWDEVLGNTAAQYTSDLKLSNGTLFVKVSSSILRQELFMQRSRLVEQLNQKVGAKIVLKIMFR
ncbi:MAG: DUF721 domain-containing protein [Paludibacteraceae bacterium]|jgi:predicted nucleic acid-binding Zn ribbon protein|nr:DUF721 domain-containing protein [Paludibacteraceae bacterium]